MTKQAKIHNSCIRLKQKFLLLANKGPSKYLTEAQIENGNKYLAGDVSLLALILTTAITHCWTVKAHHLISPVIRQVTAVPKEAKHAQTGPGNPGFWLRGLMEAAKAAISFFWAKKASCDPLLSSRGLHPPLHLIRPSPHATSQVLFQHPLHLLLVEHFTVSFYSQVRSEPCPNKCRLSLGDKTAERESQRDSQCGGILQSQWE